MMLQDVSDLMLCRVFPATLKGSAQKWYLGLKSNTIGTFAELATAFKGRFRTNIPLQKNSSDLRKCRHGEGETLKNFVERFNKEAVQIEHLNHDTAIEAMKMGTRFERLRDKILMKKPSTFQELMAIAHKYVELDEARRTLTKQYEEDKPERYRSRGGDDRTQRFGRGNKPFDFTPLNRAPMEIFSWMKNNRVMYNAPRKLHPDKERDKSKYCRFHEGYGHDTDRCWDLKREIEQLIQSGVLKKFVRTEGSAEKRKPEHVEKEEANKRFKEPMGVINMIEGGEPYSKAQKKKIRKGVYSISTRTSAEELPLVTFGPEDGRHVQEPHNDTLVIKALINNFRVMRILVDEVSAVNLLTLQVFRGIRGSVTDLRQVSVPLVGLGGKPIRPEGMVELEIILGEAKEGPLKTMTAVFNVVDIPLAYNAILGRPFLYQCGAVTSIKWLTLKIPDEEGIVTVKGSQLAARECNLITEEKGKSLNIEAFPEDPEEEEGDRNAPVGNVREFQITQKKAVMIGTEIPEAVAVEIKSVLQKNGDTFAADASEVVGIDPTIASHKLTVYKDAKPVVQKKRRFAEDRRKIIEEEVRKLEAAKFIREVMYPEWVANVVLVKKANGGYRMCVDFTDLNKACPKDNYPLPNIDQLVDSTACYQLYSLADAK
ncbi:uncharacterized protein LOC126657019 [Mercurialis annua]|uniref:uncharacterized protein LOC126657019 n=1 Tax=Mercurialis annua TaxID=3986 RepID=UPI00215E13D9|nr:uncharacterized protein LOC126657019 [Mercurialis annua]